MARAGDVIENPIHGYRVTFLKTTRETNGELLQIEFAIKAGGSPSPWHIHLVQYERFETVAGRLGVRLDTYDNYQVLDVGQSVEIHAPRPHQFSNASPDDEVRFIFDIRPAQKFEPWLETYFGLARDGEIRRNGLPKNLLQAMVLADMADTYFVGPRPLAYAMRYMLRGLAAFARLLGYKETYPQYSRD